MESEETRGNWTKGEHGYFTGSKPGGGKAHGSSGKSGKTPALHKGGGTASGSDGVSPLGKNHFSVRGFSSAQKLNNHWENGRTHKAEYIADGILTKEAYESRALELLESPVGGNIRGHMDKHGNITRYDVLKNDFAKGHPRKGVSTLFKPKNGIEYYEEMRKGDLEHGGKG